MAPQPTIFTLTVYLAVLVMAIITPFTSGEEEVLNCYTCSSTTADNTCYTDPDNAGSVPVTKCKLGPDQCCIIQRNDEKENLGTATSFFRGCRPDCDPDLIGKMEYTDDFKYRVYQTYCAEHKCNNGEGNEQPGQNNGNDESINGIDGINGATCINSVSIVLPFLTAIMLLIVH